MTAAKAGISLLQADQNVRDTPVKVSPPRDVEQESIVKPAVQAECFSLV